MNENTSNETINETPESKMESLKVIRDLVSNYSGIFFDDDKLYILENRLVSRFNDKKDHAFTFEEYYNYLLRYEDELVTLIDYLIIPETYFFRETDQLETFTNDVIINLIKHKKEKGEKVFRIWSAGCASGEEAYTIAMLTQEHKQLFDPLRVEVLASDISQRQLEIARRGVYPERSLWNTTPYYIEKYFTLDKDNHYKVNEDIKKFVYIFPINLMDQDKLKQIKNVDVIFCRNVIIYFGLEARKKLVDSFYSVLNEKGFLLLGHAESLMKVENSFKVILYKKALIYSKR